MFFISLCVFGGYLFLCIFVLIVCRSFLFVPLVICLCYLKKKGRVDELKSVFSCLVL